mgnify:CR=1 FL=1
MKLAPAYFVADRAANKGWLTASVALLAVLALGGGVCFALAPETKGQDLANVTGHDP